MAVQERAARKTGIFVKKSTTWVYMGCANSIGRTDAATIFVRDCRAGKKKFSDAANEGVDRKVTLNAILRDFTSTDIASNISYLDFKGWQTAGTLIEFRIVPVDGSLAPVVGATKEEGKAYVANVSADAGQNGSETFTVELDVDFEGYTAEAVA